MKFTNDQLKEMAIENMKEGIEKVVNGEEEVYSSKILCIGDVIDNFKFDSIDKFYNSGTDFWQYVTFNGEKYTIFNDPYFGGIEFRKYE